MTNFQENVCSLSQILKSSPLAGVCPLMKETIRQRLEEPSVSMAVLRKELGL